MISLVLAVLVSTSGPVQAPIATCTLEPLGEVTGKSARLTATLQVPPGHHAYAEPALNGEITVKVSAPEGAKFRITKVYYPKPKLARYPAFGDDPVNAYEGIVRIPIEVLLPGAARGRANVSVRLRYQLCANSEGRCYPPKTELLSTTVSIVPRSKELSAAR